jgi:hypothetical protein
VTNERCPAGWNCAVYDGASALTTDCVPPGAKTHGASCRSVYFECAPGHICDDGAAGDGRCRALCRVAEDECPTGTTCTPFEPSSFLDGVQYGVCS